MGDTLVGAAPVHLRMVFNHDPPLPAALPDDCIGLPEALTLSTHFSIASNRGEIPTSLKVPVPTPSTCTFVIRSWGEISEREREAFRRFYVRVGDRLEDLAQRAHDSAAIDLGDEVWGEITGTAPPPTAERVRG
jgi:hypothetical protein